MLKRIRNIKRATLNKYVKLIKQLMVFAISCFFKLRIKEEVMKNKFKILLLSFILLTSCSNGRAKSYKNNFRKNEYGNHVIADAKLDYYGNLNDVEKETEVIVVGKKTKQNPSKIQKNNGYVNGVYTISEFKIEKVIKGDFKPEML